MDMLLRHVSEVRRPLTFGRLYRKLAVWLLCVIDYFTVIIVVWF